MEVPSIRVNWNREHPFVATVSVTNPGMRGHYKNLVLNQLFPSGWEINNLRLDEAEARLTGDVASYQDITG